MRKQLYSLCLIILFLGTNSVSAEPVLELEGMFWMPSLDAKAKVTKNSIGSEINFTEDLNVKDENFSEIRLGVKISDSTKLRFGFSEMKYNGDNVVNQDYLFNGKTYLSGSRVISKLDMDYFRLGFFTNYARNSKENEIGTIFELKGFSGSADLKAISLNLNEKKDFDIILPTFGFFMKVNVMPKLFVYGEISGLPAGSLGYFLDAEAGLRLKPTENIAIYTGYRILDVDAKEDYDYAKIQADGAFISVVIAY